MDEVVDCAYAIQKIDPPQLGENKIFSRPMTKADIARRYTGRPSSRGRDVEAFLKETQAEIHPRYKRKWRLRLDLITNPATRARFEAP